MAKKTTKKQTPVAYFTVGIAPNDRDELDAIAEVSQPRVSRAALVESIISDYLANRKMDEIGRELRSKQKVKA